MHQQCGTTNYLRLCEISFRTLSSTLGESCILDNPILFDFGALNENIYPFFFVNAQQAKQQTSDKIFQQFLSNHYDELLKGKFYGKSISVHRIRWHLDDEL